MKCQALPKLRFYLPICMVQFLVAFEFSVMNVAIPRIQIAFSVGMEDSQWLLSAYAISFASFLLLGGRITDIVGTKNALVNSLFIFVLATVASALSFTYQQLVFTRVIQGFSAAVVVPAALRIITESTDLDFRSRVLSWWGASASLGFALGVSSGGFLVHFLSWEAIFWACALIGVFILSLLDKDIQNRPTSTKVDLKGVLSFFVFSISGISALSLFSNSEYRDETVYAFILSLISLVFFIFLENRNEQPVFPKGFLKNKMTVYANLFNILAVISGGSMVYFISEYCNRELGWSELNIGLALIPDALAAAVGARFAVQSLIRVGTVVSLTIGFLFITTGMFGLAFLQPENPYVFISVVIFTSCVGFGLVLTGVVCTILASSNVNKDCHGVSAGLINATQQWGLAIGLALLMLFSKSNIATDLGVSQLNLRAFLGGGSVGLISLIILYTYRAHATLSRRRM